MSDLPQLERALVDAAGRRVRRGRRPALRVPRPRWGLLPPLAGAALLVALVVVMLLPREPAREFSSAAGTPLERLAGIVPAFARPERAGDRPRHPDGMRGAWRLLGRRDGRRAWLGLVRVDRRSAESLCLVADWRPWAQEAIDCRPAAPRLDGRRVLGFLTHAQERGRITTAYAVVPASAELVVFTRERGSPIVADSKAGGLVARTDRAGLTGLQIRDASGAARSEPFRVRRTGIPGGLVDSYAAWRRDQAPTDRALVTGRSPGSSTWRRVAAGARGVDAWMSWTGGSLCLYVLPPGRRLGGATCVAQDEAYGGVVRRDPDRPLYVLALPDRVAAVEVVRAGGSAVRFATEENGAVATARPGDRALRLLDAGGALLQERPPGSAR